MKTGEWGTITRSKCVSQDVAAAEAELSKLMVRKGHNFLVYVCSEEKYDLLGFYLL